MAMGKRTTEGRGAVDCGDRDAEYTTPRRFAFTASIRKNLRRFRLPEVPSARWPEGAHSAVQPPGSRPSAGNSLTLSPTAEVWLRGGMPRPAEPKGCGWAFLLTTGLGGTMASTVGNAALQDGQGSP